MRCSACGADNAAGAKFCSSCGAGLAAACPSCGHHNPPTSRFCNECGAALTWPSRPAAPAAESRAASPRSYTPEHLAERILVSRSALEGERKQVTVLFADIKGSTELIEGLDPEDAQVLLDGAVKAMMEAVHRYEGTVNHILGDGIMALFGAPLAHEDHAVRACYAALAMQEAIRTYSEEVRRRHGIPVRARIGLNSGEVVVRAIANDLRMDYTALGQTVHLAARMEQVAEAGTALLTPDTLALAEGYVHVRSLGLCAVKGLAEQVPVYQLLGTGRIRTRLEASGARGLTRFVGRDAELVSLVLAQARAQAGHGQVVAVIGEPGIGKSRLFYEFTHSPSIAGWRVLETDAASYTQGTPYLPVVNLLRACCRIDPHDDTPAIREKVTGKLLALDRGLEPALPPLLALLDVPIEDPAWQALDPARRRRQTLDAVRRLLLRESREQPLLLLFENLHWIDPGTQAMLDSLVEDLTGARLLLLVNYRPEYSHGWGNRSCYTQLRLDPLPSESAGELLRAMLGDDPGLEPLKHQLIERTAGNPFFLEESVRTLVEAGALAGERGAYRLVQPLADVRVPATVQAVLAARIDRLSAEEKRLLQSAAVIGKDVPFGLLQAIADLPEQDLRRGLRHLQAAEFLYEVSLFPEPEYRFKHGLTHEVAYGTLLRERRRALHARILEAIETLYADRLAEQVERLAHHALRGEVWVEGIAYARQAGLKAAGRFAHREAVAHFEQALEALGHLPEDRDRLEQAIDLRFELRSSLQMLGEIRQVLDRLREAEAIAEALGDRRRLGQASAFMSSCFWHLGEHDRAIEAGQRTLAIAEALGDIPFQAVASFHLAHPYRDRGDYRRAIHWFRRNVALLEGELLRERLGLAGYPAAMSRSNLAVCFAELGEFDEGIAYGDEAVRIGEAVEHPSTQVIARANLGGLYVRRGELSKAIAILERGLELCQTWHFPLLFPLVASRLGLAYAIAGRATDGLSLLAQAVASAASNGNMSEAALRSAWLGETYLLAGRIEDARRFAGRALDLSVRHKERASQAWALRLLGEIASYRDLLDAEQAEGYYRRALGLAEELGMRPLEAHCRHGLGTLYRRTGRLEQARAEHSAAIESFRSMGMTLWLPAAEADLAKATASPYTRCVG